MIFFLLLLLLFIRSTLSANEVAYYDVPPIALQPNDTVSLSLLSQPENGTLAINNIALITGTLISSIDSIRYSSNIPYSFSVISGTNCTTGAFTDLFYVDALVVHYANGTDLPSTGEEHQSLEILVCLVDGKDPPISTNTYVAINQTEVQFTLSAIDPDDRSGTKDGLWSTFAFYGSDGLLLPASGFEFTQTSFASGEIRQTDCTGPAIDSFVTQPSDTFCFALLATNGPDALSFTFRPVDSNGTKGELRVLRVTTRELMVCGSPLFSDTRCSNNMSETLDGVNNSLTFRLPSQFVSFEATNYSLRIDTLPMGGDLYTLNGTLVNETGWNFLASDQFIYVPRFGYFNCYSVGISSFCNGPDGGPLPGCGNTDGCPDTIQYRTVANLSVSILGSVSFVVYREMGINMQVCTEGFMRGPACQVYGFENELIPIYLYGSDGGQTPNYRFNITSLPINGNLYRNAQPTSTSFIIGSIISAGDVIEFSNIGPTILFLGQVGYRTLQHYDTSPETTYTSVDSNGDPISFPCSGIEECGDSFTYTTISGYDPSFQSAEGTFYIGVAKESGDEPMVCGYAAYSEWNTSCVSQGYENNTWYGEYDIPIYLNSNLSETEGAYVYIIRSLPKNGTLFFNDGTDDQMERGDPVVIGSTVAPPLTPDFPVLLYVGQLNFHTEVFYETDGRIAFTDLNEKPIIECPDFLQKGCPDNFTFQAVMADGRRSNLGNYFIHVYNSQDDGFVDAPIVINVPENTTFNFASTNFIHYTDPDEDLYYIWVQILINTGLVGTSSPLPSNITFKDVESETCFPNGGCNHEIDFFGMTSDVNKVLAGLFFTLNKSITTIEGNVSDPETIFLSIIKPAPDGLNPTRPFTRTSEDILIVGDIYYGNNTDDDDYNPDDYVDDGYEVDPREVYAVQNAESNSKLTLILAAVFGSLGFVTILIIGGWFVFLRKPAVPTTTPVVPPKIRTPATARTTAAGMFSNTTKRPLKNQKAPFAQTMEV